MPAHDFVSPDSIRAQFSAAMSLMYKQEVPYNGTSCLYMSDMAPSASAPPKNWPPSPACLPSWACNRSATTT